MSRPKLRSTSNYFKPLDWAADWGPGHAALTIHLNPRTKAILRAEALAAQTSMGALVRQWIAERLELQGRRKTARESLSDDASPETVLAAGGGESQSSLAVSCGGGAVELRAQPNASG